MPHSESKVDMRFCILRNNAATGTTVVIEVKCTHICVHGQVDQADTESGVGRSNVAASQIAHLVHDQNRKHGHEDRDNKPVASHTSQINTQSTASVRRGWGKCTSRASQL